MGTKTPTILLKVQTLVPVPSAKSPLGKPKDNSPTRTTEISLVSWVALQDILPRQPFAKSKILSLPPQSPEA